MKPVVQSYIKIGSGGKNNLITTTVKNNNVLGMQFLMKHYDFDQRLLNNVLLGAVQNNADAIISLLVAKGAKIDRRVHNNGCTLLHCAVPNGAEIESTPLLAQHIDRTWATNADVL